MFTKLERSTFKYWFAHWCAYQMTALNLRIWKPKYLLHDIEKPFLKLILPYSRVKEIHRKRSKHHIEYRNPSKRDWEALMIDWECSRFTKENAPRTCREEIENKKLSKPEWYSVLKENVIPLCDKYNI